MGVNEGFCIAGMAQLAALSQTADRTITFACRKTEPRT